MTKKFLFISEGDLLAGEELALARDVIPALLMLQRHSFECVLLGPGDSDCLQLIGSQGIYLRQSLCPHAAGEGCGCAFPGLGLLKSFLREPSWDRARSAIVGNSRAASELADHAALEYENIDEGWLALAERRSVLKREATVTRVTRETDITVKVDLDNRFDRASHIATGIGYFDHMLEQLAKHGGFWMDLRVKGDLHIDEHHTVEDSAIALGEALSKALGDKTGVGRYGFLLPMDESESKVSLDLGGRPYLRFEGTFPRESVGGLPTELVPHFYRSLSQTLGAALHIEVRGENAHHMVESTFKSVGRSLRSACALSGGCEVPSTKGSL